MHKIIPTVKIKMIDGKLYQCVLVDSEIIFIPETQVIKEVVYDFHGEQIIIKQKPVPHCIVHVICTSHHDLGYTDISSEVLKKYTQALKQAVDDAYADADYRISIESYWSLEEYMETTDNIYRDKMLELLKSERFELNATYGNMITEVMGHAELYNSVRPALEFSEIHGFPVISASHNDIPGFSWGFCRALCDNGVKMLVMGFPEYNNWGEKKLPCQWDFRKTLGHDLPGGVVWESPNGKKLLMWITDQQYGPYPSLRNLDEMLNDLYSNEYPYEVLRYPVIGASQDNSPYHAGYAESIRKWNSEWDYPKLLMSTNAEFYRDFEKYLPSLKVIRGSVPGCDYPAGHLSLPDTSALNAYNRAELKSAETLAFMTESLTGGKRDDDLFKRAQRAVLRYDEHCTSFHFPCGPTATAAKFERKLYAYKAASYIYEASEKAMAEIADHINTKEEEGLILVVFNPTAYVMTATVETLMREFDNGGQYLRWMNDGYYKIAQVADRFHYNPQNEFLEGKFKIIDTSNNEVPFALDIINDINEPEPYAAQRLGTGNGTRRYGFFENPCGIKQTLRFIARDLPPFGYRAYKLLPSENESRITKTDNGQFIENEYYKIIYEDSLIYIFDKQTGKNLLDPDGYIFGEILTRTACYNVQRSKWIFVCRVISNIRKCLYFRCTAEGHPDITMRIGIYHGIKRFDANYKITKDETPLLTTAIAFPFKAERAEFTFDASLHTAKPAEDILDGAYSDISCLYGWIRQDDMISGNSIICSPSESSVFCMSEFRDIYISTAHRCYMDYEKAVHLPETPDDFRKGNFFSIIDCGNFGTNFALSDTATWVMRFAFTTAFTTDGIEVCERFSESVKNHPQAIFKHPERNGKLPAEFNTMTITGDVSVLYVGNISDGTEAVLWNRASGDKNIVIAFNGKDSEIKIPADTVKRILLNPENKSANSDTDINITGNFY